MLVFLEIFQSWLILHKIVQFHYLLSKYRLPDLHIVLKSVIFFSKLLKTKIVPFNYLNTLHKENATLIKIKVDKIPVTLTLLQISKTFCRVCFSCLANSLFFILRHSKVWTSVLSVLKRAHKEKLEISQNFVNPWGQATL